MATFVAIPEKTQTAIAMKRVLEYVMQDKKTIIDGVKLVSGQNCVPEVAYNEFMATKHRFNKAKGVFFKQYVQSFKPDCGATPQQIHQIGLETAKAFNGFEVVVATHIDRDHWHNHFVVNSVNSETGLKIQINERGLEELRQCSDKICQQFGLEVLEPYKKPNQRSMNQKEYRTALRGDSKKLRLMNAIDTAVVYSRSKEEFIEFMKRLEYGVKWIDNYKYITYTTPDGQRFRDNRLFDNKYLKTNMEDLYGLRCTETKESNTNDKSADPRNSDGTLQTGISDSPRGAVQCTGESCDDGWRANCEKHGFDFRITHTGNGYNDDSEWDTSTSGNYERSGIQIQPSNGEVYEEPDGRSNETDKVMLGENDDRFESQRYITLENSSEMVDNRSDIANGIMDLAGDIQMMFQTNNRKDDKKKYVNERKNKRKNSQNESNNGFNMSM